MLAGFNLSLISLRDTADPEPRQPLSSLRAALVSQIRGDMEPFRRTRGAVVFIWPSTYASYRGRLARDISDLPHRQW